MSTQSINDNAYEKIYAEYKDLVFRTALKYVDQNEYIAEEIMQEVFLSLLRHREKMDEEYLKGWLLLVAKNKAQNYEREHRREILDEDIEFTMDAKVYSRSAEDICLENEKRKRYSIFCEEIFSKLYKVNPRWFEVVLLVCCLDKRQQDVADEMGIGLGVLHSVLHRAREWIKKNFNDKKDEIL